MRCSPMPTSSSSLMTGKSDMVIVLSRRELKHYKACKVLKVKLNTARKLLEFKLYTARKLLKENYTQLVNT